MSRKPPHIGGKGEGAAAFEHDGARVARAQAPAVPEAPEQKEKSLFLSELEALTGRLIKELHDADLIVSKDLPTSYTGDTEQYAKFTDDVYRSARTNIFDVCIAEYFRKGHSLHAESVGAAAKVLAPVMAKTNNFDARSAPAGHLILADYFEDKELFSKQYTDKNIVLPGVVYHDTSGSVWFLTLSFRRREGHHVLNFTRPTIAGERSFVYYWT